VESNRVSTRAHIKKRIANSTEYNNLNNEKYDYEQKEERIKAWRKWSGSKKRAFPAELEARAVELNKEQGFDIYDNYGFAFVYYSFIENSDELAKEIVRPTKFEITKYTNTRRTVTH